MPKTSKSVNPHYKSKSFRNQQFKKNYGSIQEGHGVAFLQKQKIVQKYKKLQWKEKKQIHKKLEETGDSSSPISGVSHESSEDVENIFGAPKAKRKSKLQKAKTEYLTKIKEKHELRLAKNNKRKEIEEKRERYKEKRFERYKKLNQKTRKGQPLMRGRMELMLNSIEQSLKKN